MPGIVDQSNAERVAVLLTNLSDAAEFEPRPAGGFGLVEAHFFVRLDLPLDVEPQFVIDLAVDRRSPEQRSESKEEVAQHGALRYTASSTCVMAALSRRQASVSASSCA